IILLTVQLIYGAFMAGLKAAMAAPTWPDINGDMIPPTLFQNNWFSAPINVHFVHRSLAYVLFVVIIWGYIKMRKAAKLAKVTTLNNSALWAFGLVVAQVILGIVTVLSAPKIVPGHFGIFELLAELHQLVAMSLLMALIVSLYLVRKHRLVVHTSSLFVMRSLPIAKNNNHPVHWIFPKKSIAIFPELFLKGDLHDNRIWH